MADSLDYRGLNLTGSGDPAPPSITDDSYESGVQNDRDALKAAHRRNVSLGLLAAGLATLSAQSRDPRRSLSPWQALGQGGLAGLQTYASGEAGLSTDEFRKRQFAMERAKLNADVGLKYATLGLTKSAQEERAQHDKDWKELTQQQRDTAQAAQRSTDAQHKAEVGHWATDDALRAQQIGVEASTAGSMAGLRASTEAKNQADITELQPYPKAAIKSYLQLAIPKDQITPELVDSFAQMPRKDFHSTLNDMVREARTGVAKSMSPAAIEVQAEKDAQAAYKNARGKIFSSADFQGKSLSEPDFISAYKAQRVKELSQAGGAAPAVAAPAGVPAGARLVRDKSGKAVGYTTDGKTMEALP